METFKIIGTTTDNYTYSTGAWVSDAELHQLTGITYANYGKVLLGPQGSIQVSQPAPFPTGAGQESNLAWLDRRVQEMRVRL